MVGDSEAVFGRAGESATVKKRIQGIVQERREVDTDALGLPPRCPWGGATGWGAARYCI
jgi:hypothetical protein